MVAQQRGTVADGEVRDVGKAREGPVECGLVGQVERGRRLVQDDEARPAQQHARNRRQRSGPMLTFYVLVPLHNRDLREN